MAKSKEIMFTGKRLFCLYPKCILGIYIFMLECRSVLPTGLNSISALSQLDGHTTRRH